MPQGSVLGPLPFVLYTAFVIGIAPIRGIQIHVYADDTYRIDLRQLRRIGSSTRCHSSVGLRIGNRILGELQTAETDCLENRMRLDWHSTTTLQGRGRNPDGLWAISHADGEGTGSRCLHRPGADNGGSHEHTVRGCMYQLRTLYSVKRSLTLDSRRALATAFVASRIDNWDGVLYGVAKGKVQLLQMVLNAAARLAVGTGKFSHVTPILHDVLHWLPVQHRISYKIAILARDCIHGIGPAYFGDVCAPVADALDEPNCFRRRVAIF